MSQPKPTFWLFEHAPDGGPVLGREVASLAAARKEVDKLRRERPFGVATVTVVEEAHVRRRGSGQVRRTEILREELRND